jgi:structural maintenance of chromosome 2
MNAMLDEERAKLSHYDDELKELDGAIRGQKQSMADLELDLKKLDHDVETLAREQERAQAMVAELEKIHEWVATEKRQVSVIWV